MIGTKSRRGLLIARIVRTGIGVGREKGSTARHGSDLDLPKRV